MPSARSDDAVAYHRWYRIARWRRLRKAQLRLEPLCCKCRDEGRLTAAAVVDHIRPHRGNPALFWDPDNLQSLCRPHHDATKQREERGRVQVRIGTDGWPA